MILAIDTSVGTSVAVVAEDGRVLAEVESENTRGHAEVIGTFIERALAAAGAVPADISLVAVGRGPGPFTGLRIGIAAARAFALGRGIAVSSVTSHDAAALTALHDVASGGVRPLAIVTDARRREVAVSVYDGLDQAGLPHRVLGPALRPAGSDLASDPAVAGTDPAAAAGSCPASGPAISAAGTGSRSAEPLDVRETTRIPAAGVGRIAAIRHAGGHDDEPGEPLYLRAPDVSLPAQRKRVTA